MLNSILILNELLLSSTYIIEGWFLTNFYSSTSNIYYYVGVGGKADINSSNNLDCYYCLCYGECGVYKDYLLVDCDCCDDLCWYYISEWMRLQEGYNGWLRSYTFLLNVIMIWLLNSSYSLLKWVASTLPVSYYDNVFLLVLTSLICLIL